ncbi:hypothetical protein RB195_016135 [Necator americanus]|uniref:Cystatin domain protein n=2 Tax=Necator americanus TaxID=51031 RepID=W2T650_NECAM|nr:cystatin domain protein [Necator americanus]ETN77353.1 cystatin domain protein [Necator americanus]
MPPFVSLLALLCLLTFADSQMPGGLTFLNASDPEIMEKSWKAVSAVNKKLKDGHDLMVPDKVVKAQSQAGTRYIFEIIYGESTCKKEEANTATAAKCPLKPNGHKALYNVELLEKPGEKEQFNAAKITDIPAEEKI